MQKKLNGNAIIINRLLTELSRSLVPTAVRPKEVDVIIIPQISLCTFDGFSLPPSENIPNTKMAESTELMIAISTSDVIRITVI